MVLTEKGILKDFEIVVYPVPIVVVIGDMAEEVNRMYNPLDEGDTSIDKPMGDCGATTYHVESKEHKQYCLLVWFPSLNECKGSFLCHESGHMALEIFRYIGAKMNYEDQEPFCYLLGTVFRLINGTFYEYKEFLEKKTTKKKKK